MPESESYEQLSLFDTEETIQDLADDEKTLEKERALQEAMLKIKHKFGKNFKPVMTLKDGEYGRIVYNEREATFDGEWYYIRTTINLYSTDISKYRKQVLNSFERIGA